MTSIGKWYEVIFKNNVVVRIMANDEEEAKKKAMTKTPGEVLNTQVVGEIKVSRFDNF